MSTPGRSCQSPRPLGERDPRPRAQEAAGAAPPPPLARRGHPRAPLALPRGWFVRRNILPRSSGSRFPPQGSCGGPSTASCRCYPPARRLLLGSALGSDGPQPSARAERPPSPAADRRGHPRPLLDPGTLSAQEPGRGGRRRCQAGPGLRRRSSTPRLTPGPRQAERFREPLSRRPFRASRRTVGSGRGSRRRAAAGARGAALRPGGRADELQRSAGRLLRPRSRVAAALAPEPARTRRGAASAAEGESRGASLRPEGRTALACRPQGTLPGGVRAALPAVGSCGVPVTAVSSAPSARSP